MTFNQLSTHPITRSSWQIKISHNISLVCKYAFRKVGSSFYLIGKLEAQKMRDCRVRSHEWGIYGTQPHSQDSGNSGKGVERIQEPEFRSDCQQMVFFRHKSGCCHEFTAVVAPAQHQDSLDSSLHPSLDGGWLGGHTWDLDSLHPSLDGGWLQEATVLTEQLLQSVAARRGRVIFLAWCDLL